MIPVYAHRYLPAGRGTYGHPVLSIYQTEAISSERVNQLLIELRPPSAGQGPDHPPGRRRGWLGQVKRTTGQLPRRVGLKVD